MGYSTSFKGVLKFAKEPTAPQLAELKKYLGEDIREIDKRHPRGLDDFHCHIDLELTDDFTGVQWSGAEKTSGMVEIVNYLTDRMRERWPDFAFTGVLAAQGEKPDDRWKLVMKNGTAKKAADPPMGRKVKCPHCEQDFFLE